jgi:hypothetical protein
MNVIEDCTTTAAISRHLSLDLTKVDEPYITGRIGRTLCGHRAYDERAASENRGRPIRFAQMKPCGSCARSAAKIEREAAP